MSLIDRGKAINAIKDITPSKKTDDYTNGIRYGLELALWVVRDRETVDAIPVKYIETYIDAEELKKDDQDDEYLDKHTMSYWCYAVLNNWLNEPEKEKWLD